MKKTIIALLTILNCLLATARERVISTDEYLFALSIFPREFPPQYDITITDGVSPTNGAYYVRPTVGAVVGKGSIIMNMGDLYDNCLASKGIFAHELTHVWQVRHFGIPWYLKEFIDNQVYCRAKDFITNSDSNPYKYNCSQDKKLEDYNAESQGEIVRKAFLNNSCEIAITQKTLSTKTWRLLIGSSAKDIAFGNDNSLFLTNTAGKIYKYDGKEWKQIAGSDGVAIATNTGKTIMANTAGKIYEWDGNNWKQLTGSDAKDVAVATDGTYWMVNTSGKIYHFTNNKWEQVQGQLAKAIATGNNQLCIINTEGDYYKLLGSKWFKINGRWGDDLTISQNGDMYKVANGFILKWTGTIWEKLDGSDAVAISANNGQLYMVNTVGRIYYMNTNKIPSIGEVKFEKLK